MATNPSQTSRFGIYRWQLDTDTFKREHMDTSHQRIEDRGALIYQGTSQPGSSTGQYDKAFWFDTTNKNLHYSDGSSWRIVSKPAATNQIAALSIAVTASSAGTAREFAPADHVHAGPGFAAPVSIGSANSAGTATTAARSDHVHVLGSKVVLPAHVDDTVASNGLQRTSSGLQVKAADGTIAVTSSGVAVGTGFATNAYTATGQRLIHTGTVAPTGSNVATGDLWVDTTNPASSVTGDQIKQYRTGTGWTAISVTQRTPAAKFAWTSDFVSTVASEVVVAPLNAALFPATLAEQEPWFPNQTTPTLSSVTTFRCVRIPYSGYYMLHGNMAWLSKGSGSRQIWLARQAASGGQWVEMDGGMNTTDLAADASAHTVFEGSFLGGLWNSSNAATSANYTRAMAWTFASLDQGDLIAVVGRTIGAGSGTTTFSGANLSITYVSAR
jgi:hypothetical protein